VLNGNTRTTHLLLVDPVVRQLHLSGASSKIEICMRRHPMEGRFYCFLRDERRINNKTPTIIRIKGTTELLHEVATNQDSLEEK